MSKPEVKTVLTQMNTRTHSAWVPEHTTKQNSTRLLRNTSVLAAVSLCLGAGWFMLGDTTANPVMSHLSAGFEYDETLGRLQYVSNILPESAMVFLSNSHDPVELFQPANTAVTHSWSSEEPWLEYAGDCDISACQSGEIVTVVENRLGEYTVRILHENGYESLYSGLQEIRFEENDLISAGERIGSTKLRAAFEWRKDGLSTLPVFSDHIE